VLRSSDVVMQQLCSSGWAVVAGAWVDDGWTMGGEWLDNPSSCMQIVAMLISFFCSIVAEDADLA
jgi:hypothetical protein